MFLAILKRLLLSLSLFSTVYFVACQKGVTFKVVDNGQSTKDTFSSLTRNLLLSVNEDEEVCHSFRFPQLNNQQVRLELIELVSQGSLSINGEDVTRASQADSFEACYRGKLNFNGSDRFVFKLISLRNGIESEPIIVDILVKPVEDGVTSSDLHVAINEDQAYSGGISISNVDGVATTFRVTSAPGNASLLFTNPQSGRFLLTPNRDYFGLDEFSYTVSDTNNKVLTSGKVTIEVRPINDAPVAANLTASLMENTSKEGNLSATDVDSASLTYSIVNSAAGGTFEILDATSGSYRYSPRVDFSGEDTVSYMATDGSLNSNVATLKFTVTEEPNAVPVASALSVSVDENMSTNGAMLATDEDGDPLTYSVNNNPAFGSLSYESSSGEFLYTPNPGYYGPDSFTFSVSDGKDDSESATVSITVNEVNGRPVAYAQNYTLLQGATVAGKLNGIDPDGDALKYSIVGLGVSLCGSFSLTNPDTGDFSYVAGTNCEGTYSFNYIATDPGGLSSSPVAINFTVSKPNVAPVATSLNIAADDTGSATGQLTGTDADNDTLTFSRVNNASNGVATVNSDGSFTYQANNDFYGQDTFTFRVFDGTDYSNTATVSISIVKPNTAPVANALEVAANETGFASGQLTGNDADNDTLSFSRVNNASNGVATVNSDGSFTYQANNDFYGQDTFTFRVFDGTDYSNTATVSISIVKPNKAPVAKSLSFTGTPDTDTSGKLSCTDSDGDSLSYARVTGPALGGADVQANGDFIYYIEGGVSGTTQTFTYKCNDGKADSNVATVSITYPKPNKKPIAKSLSFTGVPNTNTSGKLSCTDSDGDSLTYARVSNPAAGTVSVQTNGNFTYNVASNTNGTTQSFSYKCNDGKADSNIATVSITYPEPNNKPVAINGSRTAGPGTHISGTLSGTDADGDPLTFILVSPPSAGGTVSISSNTGIFYYGLPSTSWTGTTSFTFKANDGKEDSNVATFTITIEQPNRAPTASNLSFTGVPGQTVSGNLSCTDLDGDSLTYTKVNGAALGRAIVNTNGGSFMYEPEGGVPGTTQTFTYRCSDGSLSSNTATVSITYPSDNDAPVAPNYNFVGIPDNDFTGQLVCTDADGDSLTYTRLARSNLGEAVVSQNGSFEYWIEGGVDGTTQTFTYKCNDGKTDSNTGTVNITYSTRPRTYSTTYTFVSAGDGQAQMKATDVDGHSMTWDVREAPTAGTFSYEASSGWVNFQPPVGSTGGTWTVRFRVRDSSGAYSNTAVLTLIYAP